MTWLLRIPQELLAKQEYLIGRNWQFYLPWYFMKNCWWQIIVVVKFQAMKWTRPDHKSKWSRKVKHWNSQGGLRDWDSNAPAQLVMMDFNGEHHTISFTRLVSCPCLMPVSLVRICPDVHHSDENNHVWCWLYLTLHLVLAPSRHSSPSKVVSRTG